MLVVLTLILSLDERVFLLFFSMSFGLLPLFVLSI